MNKDVYFKAMLIGGGIGGLLSGIPLINSCNCLCCMWVILGGVVSAYILVYSARGWPTDGEGAIVGVGSGVMAGIVAGLISFLQILVMGKDKYMGQFQGSFQGQNLPPEFQQALEQWLQMWNESFFVFFLLGAIFNVIIFTGFAVLGGIIGIRIFRPRRFGPYPPGGMPPYGQGGWPPQGGMPGGPGHYGGQYGPPQGSGGYPPPGPPPVGPSGRFGGPPPGGQGGSFGGPPAGWPGSGAFPGGDAQYGQDGRWTQHSSSPDEKRPDEEGGQNNDDKGGPSRGPVKWGKG